MPAKVDEAPLAVALVTPQFSLREAGGGELWSRFVAMGLAARGHRVDVLTLDDRDRPADPDARLRVHVLADLSRRSVRRALRSVRPDVVESINLPGSIPAIRAARSLGLPIVVQANSAWATCLFGDSYRPGFGIVERCTLADVRQCLRVRPPENVTRRVPALVGWAEIQRRIWGLRRATRLVAATQASKHLLTRNRFAAEKIRVVPNFYDPAFVAPPRADGERILCAGALIPSKGPQVLVEAFGLLAARRPNARLEFVGKGFYRPNLERRVAELGLQERVDFLGYIPYPELRPYFQRASVLAFPVRAEESFGRVLLDAWCTGLPVVASRVSAPGELVRHGETGLLVPADDAPSLAQALEQVLTDPDLARRLAAGGRRELERFHPDVVLDQLVAVYRDAIRAAA